MSTELSDESYQDLIAELLAEAGVATGGLPAGVELVRRDAGEQSWLFALNHTDAPVRVPANGVELASRCRVDGELAIAAGGFAVVRLSKQPT